MPNIGDMVWYVLPSRAFAPAIVSRVHGENLADLVVFANANDGAEYATGTAAKLRVSRYVKQDGDEYPTVGTWFVPQGQFAKK